LDRPSERYGSTPTDGPVAGKAIGLVINRMVEDYYRWMGWDPQTGKPTPDTLAKYGLEWVTRDLYPFAATP
jgi:aldehyde:ferredoxin oxidoreductase